MKELSLKNLCMGCMKINIGEVCPFCGTNKNFTQEKPFLNLKYILDKKYLVGKKINVNAESIGYIGYDLYKKITVYIKEFFPSRICSRDVESDNILFLKNKKEIFKQKFEEFSNYFKNLTKLRCAFCFMLIYDLIKENNTFYVISEWINGISLKEYVLKRKYLKWEETKVLFTSFISGLIKMHEFGILHLKISPENIIVDHGKLKLLGFATENLRKLNNVYDYKLNNVCYALEQYAEKYSLNETTDVYGLASSIFFSLTGEFLSSALERKKHATLLMSENIIKNLPKNVISGIANALKIFPNERTISFEKFKIELLNSEVTEFQNLYKCNGKEKSIRKKSGLLNLGLVSGLSFFMIVVVFIGFYNLIWKKNDIENQSNEKNESTSENILNKVDNDSNNNFEESLEKKIIVPNLINQNYEELKNQNNLDFNIFLLSEIYSDIIKEGNIVSQTPSNGERIYKNSSVAVNVSKGSKNRILPEISNMSISEVSKLLIENKLNPIAEYVNSNIPEGLVINYKNNAAGDILECNSDIYILISKGAN
ncbi:MAG: PASTA domain-containing protein [Candidatus Paraimprobicoccus trichonymphae]|uniref:PASTA domain-containing protein n=1 Tax=Candidatus Paraimprobicoccus trichonymphae TaxID=3033793 RepID=A0AA48I2T0_9FIRM|nr:MAG: PASTA domain-containing protein [Candidatus Paraimprobicoccus trichonymphae]